MSQISFLEQFEALVVKYTELLTGKSDAETVEKVKIMAIYNHISKTMPPLLNHFNLTHPEAKEDIRKIFTEIKELNELKNKGKE